MYLEIWMILSPHIEMWNVLLTPIVVKSRLQRDSIDLSRWERRPYRRQRYYSYGETSASHRYWQARLRYLEERLESRCQGLIKRVDAERTNWFFHSSRLLSLWSSGGILKAGKDQGETEGLC